MDSVKRHFKEAWSDRAEHPPADWPWANWPWAAVRYQFEDAMVSGYGTTFATTTLKGWQ